MVPNLESAYEERIGHLFFLVSEVEEGEMRTDTGC
jgi:hypothetical protein